MPFFVASDGFLIITSLSLNSILPLFILIEADQAFHQCGFSGAVFAHERVHGAGGADENETFFNA